VAKALNTIHGSRPRLSLELNIRKIEIFWPSCDDNKHHGGCSLRKLGDRRWRSNSRRGYKSR